MVESSSQLLERLVLQLRDDVTKGFAETARSNDLARVEGQLQAYQAETDRRLGALEETEHQRVGDNNRGKRNTMAIVNLVSTAALWAGVIVALFRH